MPGIKDRVVELRQYTLHPGARDTLIELFDREFIESQEACGMTVIGQFRDLDRPDRFVWLRGFPDMEARATALAAFYGGPVWSGHRDAANATMIDFDDVLLLRPMGRRLALDLPRPGRGAEAPAGLVTVTIVPLKPGSEAEFAELFEAEILPVLERSGSQVLATFVTEVALNTYPLLPVRADANVFVWLEVFADSEAHRAFADALAVAPGWQAALGAIAPLSSAETVKLRLEPTARSLLR